MSIQANPLQVSVFGRDSHLEEEHKDFSIFALLGTLREHLHNVPLHLVDEGVHLLSDFLLVILHQLHVGTVVLWSAEGSENVRWNQTRHLAVSASVATAWVWNGLRREVGWWLVGFGVGL